ncbi:MAG: DevR family CRISPR-associated autoregulator [Pyrinomonadaceae bacterium]|nr:DevR family CRISPR-associated autoregulator [Pyrinomonadaceae bacterium]
MSKHLFGLIVTPYGTAANNRGENEGNITTLQKILWKNEVHTTVSAEAIRWAFRYYWQKKGGDNSVNRRWNDETGEHNWQDQTWKPWTSNEETDNQLPTFIDDDVMGFMLAEAASTDGNDELDSLKSDKKKLDDEFKALSKEDQKEEYGKSLKEESKELERKIKIKSQGKADKRKGALEVTRAISLLPFAGDITFNAKSGTKSNTSLYGTEVHATRYQYGIALTPESLREKARVLDVIDAVVNLAEVAGNQSRFLFDFAPDSVVFRWTDDFAPRMLYGFEMDSEANLSFDAVLEKVKSGDISANELFIGGNVVNTLSGSDKELLNGASLHEGVKAAANILKAKIQSDLGV